MEILSFMTIKLLNKSFFLIHSTTVPLSSTANVITLWSNLTYVFLGSQEYTFFLGRVTDRHICWYHPVGWCSLGHNGSGRSRPCSRRSRGCHIWCHWRTHRYLREQRERRPSEFKPLRQQTPCRWTPPLWRPLSERAKPCQTLHICTLQYITSIF